MLGKFAQVYSVPKKNERKALLGIYLCKCCGSFYAGGKEVAQIRCLKMRLLYELMGVRNPPLYLTSLVGIQGDCCAVSN